MIKWNINKKFLNKYYSLQIKNNKIQLNETYYNLQKSLRKILLYLEFKDNMPSKKEFDDFKKELRFK
jgi:hypothetical protein